MSRAQHHTSRTAGSSPFSLFLRTGLRRPPGDLEFKFNPNHDPHNGQFTFAQGGGASSARVPERHRSGAAPDYGGLHPKHPRNHSPYVVKQGDTLTSIAARRKGLRPSDLAWLNDMATDTPLRTGQAIRLPHQSYLDHGRDAKNAFVALDHYMQSHDGRLPPDPAHPPSLRDQVFKERGWRKIEANGYTYAADKAERTRYVDGDLVLDASERRSRSNQIRAGRPDRRAGDDGGHYIALRFNGPRASFNHFAQDANFNRGAYRVLEDG